MRAHANCVENLPVYGAVVVAIVAADIHAEILDVLALVFMGARIVHSAIHVGFEHTNVVAGARFAFFFVQVICMAWMGLYVVLQVI